MPTKFETEPICAFSFAVPRNWRYDVKKEFHQSLGDACPPGLILEDTDVPVGNAFIVITLKRFREKAEKVIAKHIDAYNQVNTARKAQDARGSEGPRIL
jgi:hypothetical protein